MVRTGGTRTGPGPGGDSSDHRFKMELLVIKGSAQ